MSGVCAFQCMKTRSFCVVLRVDVDVDGDGKLEIFPANVAPAKQ